MQSALCILQMIYFKKQLLFPIFSGKASEEFYCENKGIVLFIVQRKKHSTLQISWFSVCHIDENVWKAEFYMTGL